jgi:hypothetical protein
MIDKTHQQSLTELLGLVHETGLDEGELSMLLRTHVSTLALADYYREDRPGLSSTMCAVATGHSPDIIETLDELRYRTEVDDELIHRAYIGAAELTIAQTEREVSGYQRKLEQFEVLEVVKVGGTGLEVEISPYITAQILAEEDDPILQEDSQQVKHELETKLALRQEMIGALYTFRGKLVEEAGKEDYRFRD